MINIEQTNKILTTNEHGIKFEVKCRIQNLEQREEGVNSTCEVSKNHMGSNQKKKDI